MNVHPFPTRAVDPVASLRASATVAEQHGHTFRASSYREMADTAEVTGMAPLYRNWAAEAAAWAAGQEAAQ